MSTQIARHSTRGQSVPLIAAMLAVLLGMTALAVDVGSREAEQRNIVRGTNAAAISGMTSLLNGGRDGDVEAAVRRSLHTNGIRVVGGVTGGEAPAEGDRELNAIYLGEDARQIGGPCGTVGACDTQIPNGVKYIQVDVNGVVNTSFARLFGQDTLGVGQRSYASRGACSSGFYPIAVRKSVNNQPLLDTTGFTEHDGYYRDEVYQDPLEYKNIYLRTSSNQSGGVSFVRWNAGNQAAGNSAVLSTSLTGAGNIGQGYAELPAWPGEIAGLATPPQGQYPNEPNTISLTDWIAGNNFSNPQTPFTDGSVRAQLDYHKQYRTVMTLPAYQFDNGDQTDPYYFVEGMYRFLLVDYGVDTDGVLPDGPWMRLAYLGSGGECATLTSPAEPTTNLALNGSVSYVPRFRQQTQPVSPPIQFLVVLDVTGSMSWNFNGNGTFNGADVNCVDGSTNCAGQNNYRWRNASERRIAIAKGVLRDFVTRFDTVRGADTNRANDMMKIVTFSGNSGRLSLGSTPNADALTRLTKTYPDGNATWTNNRGELLGYIDAAGTQYGDINTTEGSTNSALGLARASQVLGAAPTADSLGREYRRIVIFVTDGVANVLRDGRLNDSNGCGSETVSCHVGFDTSFNPPLPKPITAMVQEANLLKQNYVLPNDGKVYVVALSNTFGQANLDQVASDSSLLGRADDANELTQLFNSIFEDATTGECTPGQRSISNQIAGTEVPNTMAGVNSSTLGYVTLRTSTGEQVGNPVPITVDPATRRLSYSVQGVAPGTYTLSAWIGYWAPEDRTLNLDARLYSKIVEPSGLQNEVTVAVSNGALGGIVNRPLTLDMSGTVCPSFAP